MRSTIDFYLNGERVSLPARAGGGTVLAWLREARRLSGSKEGCAEGDCGACTVVLSERSRGGVSHLPAASCILPLGALDGRELTTVEGIGSSSRLHPVQRAMVDCHGSQCGFCTPGFVMALYAHFRGNLPCDRQALCDALAGNLCRCTGYAPILAAGEAMARSRDPQHEARQDAECSERLAALPRDGVAGDGFFAPRTIEELAAALGHHPDATLLGGATDLGLAITKGLRPLGKAIYLGRIEALKEIAERPDHLELGGAVTYAEAAAALARLHPDIGELVRRLGGAQVRACGTLAGNIANASPIGDSMPVLLALDATIRIGKAKAEREVRLADFYTGYRKTVLQPGEFIRAIRVPRLAPGARFAAYKLSKRFDQDISGLCAAFHIDAAGKARFAFGGMAATPARARRAEESFAGGVEAACAALAQDFAPLSDHRASAWYRLEAARNLLRKFARGISARAIFEVPA